MASDPESSGVPDIRQEAARGNAAGCECVEKRLQELQRKLNDQRAKQDEELRSLRQELSDLKASGQGNCTDGRTYDTELSQMWEALPNAVYDRATRTLHVATSFEPLVRTNTIYVRECYEQLTKLALSMTPIGVPADYDGTGHPSHQLLVTGTPGIGKTHWQLHLLWRLAQQGATVVVDWADRQGRFLLTRAGCYWEDRFAFVDELEDPDTWYLVDAKLPRAAAAITVETSSPDYSKTNKFMNRGADDRIMPVWELPELEAAMHLFPGVDQGKLHHLYERWGGSVRWCLEEALSWENQAKLDAGINSTDVPALETATQGDQGGNVVRKVSDRTLHLIPDADSLKFRHYAFASDYVADQVAERLWNGARQELEMFLQGSSSVSTLAALRERLFQSFAHHVLQLGGDFELRDLQTGTLSTLSLPPRPQYTFQSLEEMLSQPDAYGTPKSKSQESVDFLCQPEELGLVTINPQHGANAKGLRAAYAVLTGPKNALLTWVVPPDKFADFQLQRIDGRWSKKRPLRQRVLKMPLTSSATLSILRQPVQLI